MSKNIFKSSADCLADFPDSFLSFVHEGCFWAFAPTRFVRWQRPVDLPKEAASNLWAPFPFIWDFGSAVVVPELWAGWLPAIVGARVNMAPKVPAKHEPATVRFRGRLEPGERRVFAQSPEHYFRGDNIVFLEGERNLHLWQISINGHPQMRNKKDLDGNDAPWSARVFTDAKIPISLKFDTYQPGGLIEIDLENRGLMPVDFLANVHGVQLVEVPEKTT